MGSNEDFEDFSDFEKLFKSYKKKFTDSYKYNDDSYKKLLDELKQIAKDSKDIPLQRTELLDKFDSFMLKNDRKSLEREVVEQSYHIHSINAPDLFRKHAIACLFVDNYFLAIKSLEKVTKEYIHAPELLGAIYYSMKDYINASISFRDVKKFIRPKTTSLIKSITEWNYGDHDVYRHEFALESILKESANANTFLGTLFYNKKSYDKAQDYFVNTVLLSKSSEQSRLNSLRTLYQIDKNAAELQFGKFLYETNSSMTAEQLTNEIKKIKLEIPYFKIASLHKLADKILV